MQHKSKSKQENVFEHQPGNRLNDVKQDLPGGFTSIITFCNGIIVSYDEASCNVSVLQVVLFP